MSKKDVDLSNVTAEFRFLKIERLRGFSPATEEVILNYLSTSTYKI